MSNDPTDEHVKTVYPHYGLALYLVQCLEHGLANALVYVSLIPRKGRLVRTVEEWNAEFDSFTSRSFEQTLGRLIRDLRESTTVPSELEDKLIHTLRRRNWLTHHFFRERAEEFMSARGRDSMLRELEEAQTLFQAVSGGWWNARSGKYLPVKQRYFRSPTHIRRPHRIDRERFL